MLQRQTQTAAFWRDQFEVASNDMDFLYNLLLDKQAAKSTGELALAIIQEYIRRENTKIESELSKGTIYLPKGQYEVGQWLVFPALDFTIGEVVGVRPGQNPEHGEFRVLSVKFPNSSNPREFASGLQTGHRLNQANGDQLLSSETLLSADEIYDLYQEEIEESLLFALEEGDRSNAFVKVGDQWLLADMLAEVHVGHLNIAEAVIEMQAVPVTTQNLLDEVELDANVSRTMQQISLEHALNHDERFDRVNQAGAVAWYLRRLEPPEVVSVPTILRPLNLRYNRALLTVDLLQTEWELDDEWGESSLSSELPTIVPNTTLTLTYPHWRMGTLPLNGRTRNFFLQSAIQGGGKSTITLIDGRWGTRMPGWVVPEGRYVTGLRKWMQDHLLPVGAYITLERTAEPGEIVVDFRTRRQKREWARIATPDFDDQVLRFEMNKVPVACEYDEYMIVAEEESSGIDRLRDEQLAAGIELPQIVEQVVPELTKLNPQGTVHAKSVYSAVNVIRRCPPGPIFYLLISNRRFRDVGGGFFALA
jgi:hypothetical protein